MSLQFNQLLLNHLLSVQGFSHDLVQIEPMTASLASVYSRNILHTSAILSPMLFKIKSLFHLFAVFLSWYIIQLLMFEETTIKICRCVNGHIDRREGEVNNTFHTPINLDIGLFKHQLLIYFFFVSSVWLILSKKRRSVILTLEISKLPCFLSTVAN